MLDTMTDARAGNPVEFRNSIQFRVRYAETDQMGVVYHSNYLIWCEMARTDLIRLRGRSYAELEADGVLLAVSDASVRYHAAARYDDLIRAEAWIVDVRSRMVTFRYLISRVLEDGTTERLASASTTLVAIDRGGRPRKMPDDLMEALRGG
jgi:acyl-CoA thioester hydrolase